MPLSGTRAVSPLTISTTRPWHAQRLSRHLRDHGVHPLAVVDRGAVDAKTAILRQLSVRLDPQRAGFAEAVPHAGEADAAAVGW